MDDKALHTAFEEAVDYVNSYTGPLPADFLLKLYAYYRIARGNFANPGSKTPLINAFKANALIQAKNVGRQEAMEKYVALVASQLRESDKGNPTP